MRNPGAAALALRMVERLTSAAPVTTTSTTSSATSTLLLQNSCCAPSQILLLTSGTTSARELSNLAASVFSIDAHELRIVSQPGLLQFIQQEAARVQGLPGLSSTPSSSSLLTSSSSTNHSSFVKFASRFESQAALHSVFPTLPLDAYRPANARHKYADALYRHFEALTRAGVTPAAYAASNAEKPYETSRHRELVAAYAAWTSFKQSNGILSVADATLASLMALRNGTDEQDEGLVGGKNGKKGKRAKKTVDEEESSSTNNSSDLYRNALLAAIQDEIRHVICLDGDELDLGTMRLLHATFGAGAVTRTASSVVGGGETKIVGSDSSSVNVTTTESKTETATTGKTKARKNSKKQQKQQAPATADNSAEVRLQEVTSPRRTVDIFLDGYGNNNHQNSTTPTTSTTPSLQTIASFAKSGLLHGIANASNASSSVENFSASTVMTTTSSPYKWRIHEINPVLTTSTRGGSNSNSSSLITPTPPQPPIVVTYNMLSRASQTIITRSTTPNTYTTYNTSSSSSASLSPTAAAKAQIAAATASNSTTSAGAGGGSLGTSSNVTTASQIPPNVLNAIHAQYVQTLPTTKDITSQTSPTFAECIGLPVYVNEATAVAKVVRSLLLSSSSQSPSSSTERSNDIIIQKNSKALEAKRKPLSIAILCKSNAAATEIGMAVQMELSSASNMVRVVTAAGGGSGRSTSGSENETNTRNNDDGTGSSTNAALDVSVYADGHAELSRVPEVRWVLSLLGVLVQPRDQSNWYTLASSPLYNIPLPTIADWVRSALADAQQVGSMLRVVEEVATPAYSRGRRRRSGDSDSESLVQATTATTIVTRDPGGGWGTGWAEQQSSSIISASLSSSSLAATVGKIAPLVSESSSGARIASSSSMSSSSDSDEDPMETMALRQGGLAGAASDTEGGGFATALPPLSSMAAASGKNNNMNLHHAATAGSGMVTSSILPFIAANTVVSSTQPRKSLQETVSEGARLLLDDLRTFSEEHVSTGSVAKALASYIRRAPGLALIREPTTPAQADAASALTALLTLVHRLEQRTGGRALKSAARRYSGQLYATGVDGENASVDGMGIGTEGDNDGLSSSTATLALYGLAPVFEAVRAAVFTGRLRYSTVNADLTVSSASQGNGNVQSSADASASTAAIARAGGSSGVLVAATGDGEDDEEIIDVVEPVAKKLFTSTQQQQQQPSSTTTTAKSVDALSSSSDGEESFLLPASVTSTTSMSDIDAAETLVASVVMSANDAAAQQTFTQITEALKDNSVRSKLDTYLDQHASITTAATSSPAEGFLPPAPPPSRSMVVVTTLRKGLDHLYDVVILPGCAQSTYPGRFLSDNLPLPGALFTGTGGGTAHPFPLAAAPTDESAAKTEKPTKAAGTRKSTTKKAVATAGDVTSGTVTTTPSILSSTLSSQLLSPVDISSAPVWPSPPDRVAHEAKMHSQFLQAVSRARNGVLFFCPGVATADSGVSTRTVRTKWLDQVFGIPQVLSITVPRSGNSPASSSTTPPSPSSSIETPANETIQSKATAPSPSATFLPSLSFSSLSDYEWCPWKFRLRKIDRLVPLPASNMEYGTAMHASSAVAGELVASPIFAYLEKIGLFQEVGLVLPSAATTTTANASSSSSSSSSPAAAASLLAGRISLSRAALALHFLRGHTDAKHLSATQLRLAQSLNLQKFLTTENTLQAIRADIARSLPTFDALSRIMTAAYKDSWCPGGLYSATTTSSNSNNSGTNAATAAWCAALPTTSLLASHVADGSAADGDIYVRRAVDAHLLDASEVRAYESSATAAIRNFANRELQEAYALLGQQQSSSSGSGITSSSASSSTAPTSAPSLPKMALGLPALPALIEQHFRLAVPMPSPTTSTTTAQPSVIHLSGYIDRVDVVAIPVEQSARYRDGEDSYEANIREFKSGQQWKRRASDALRDKLRGLQPDIYGMAVRDMLVANRESVFASSAIENATSNTVASCKSSALVPVLDPAVRVAIESIELGESDARIIDSYAVANATKSIHTIVEKMKAGIFLPTPSEIACKYCGFSSTCHYAYGKTPSIETEQTRARSVYQEALSKTQNVGK